ncbi:efflux RND transporter periplasmic adaptor subunit [Rhodoplanes sp. TEM]|uniref:Efflux RND transporter periplasmic adaptor subunit n=1 Tax=Rhodoplanes tepidamans TaxID=200616 RepID=A0ABT5J854_RHOTP|nr:MULTISPECIES: efflux RND transporter periplasmic adaptor subunit [Rhodoplanes]MDC7785837.1 efflux RND transporter periplasmic adaptor subunit [Rhodoplanes tepidamans]MDC7986625.1 efflux RND transporter periplasmic adaptor subunit [Rhodoplanes sp. TEM]MDQ0354598.1 cobalt-zinc-cadmium efflux system membrane fusion protein [Rhodoplanes tepidamans]
MRRFTRTIRAAGAAGRHAAATCAAAALAVVLASAGAVAFVPSKSGDRVRVTPDQEHQIVVERVETRDFRVRKLAIGKVGYDQDATTVVSSPFSGRVVRLIARLGERVAPGAPLAELDSVEVLPPQNDHVAAVGTLAKARTQLDLARVAETRARGLYEQKAGALKDWQQAQAALVAAENDARAAETALEATRQRLRIIGRDDDQIAELEARGITSRSVVIRAPIAGTVTARKVAVGQHVRGELSEPLYAISDLSTMWLEAQVPEADLAAVRVGDTIEVKVSALPGRTFRARVAVIGSLSDAVTHRVVVRAVLPNPDGALKAEMFAAVTIETSEGRAAPAVPVRSVIREGSRDVVWVETEPMVFQRRDVTLGMEQDGRFEIRAGLGAGDRVVTIGAIFIENEWQQ